MTGIINKIDTWNNSHLRKKKLFDESSLDFLLEKYLIIGIEIIISIVFLSNIVSVAHASITGIFVQVIINVIFLLLLFLLLIEQKFSTFVRILMLLVLIFTKSLFLIILGYFETGLVFLFIFSVIAAVFLETRYSVITLALNLITITLFCLTISLTNLLSSIYQSEIQDKFITISLNFILLNVIFSLIISYFFKWLKASFQREKKLKDKLKKKSERLIEAKMKAEESDQLKSSFLANVSHEFRTPMNAIMGFTEIMLYTDPDKDKCKRYLQNIYKSSEQLLQIIHNTIEYSKIELGTIELDKSVFNIVDILDTLHEQLQHRCPPKVAYKVHGDEELITQRIYTDKEKLFQIFKNLILNAFKFTNEGEVGFGIMNSNDKENFQFFVKDTGIGIRKEKQKDIFNRFHKEDDFKEGTGLGLSISATLIFHLGGKIWLESESGKGTTFYFIIPRIKQEDIR